MTKKIRTGQVALDRDLKITKAVGSITIPSGQSYATVSATKDGRQKSVQEVLEEIFSGDRDPNVTLPSVSLTSPQYSTDGSTFKTLGSGTSYVEVGLPITAKTGVTFNAGNYEFGPTPTGCTENTGSRVLVLHSDDGDADIAADDNGVMEHALTTKVLKLNIQASTGFTAGATPKTQLGNDAAALAIAAGTTATATSGSIVTFLPTLSGCADKQYSAAIIEDIVALMSRSNSPRCSVGTEITLVSEEHDTTFFLMLPNAYLPSGKKYTIEATLPDSLNAVVNDFVRVEDVTLSINGTTASYTVFHWMPESLQNGTRVLITIKNE